MKIYLVLSALLIPIVSTDSPITVYIESRPINQHISEIEDIVSYEPTIDDLIAALIFIESSGRENAIGDTNLRTPSIGVLQIREKSIEMFMIWHNHYHTNSNFEKIARCWNGGPRGMKKKGTIKYWIKVSKELNLSPQELIVSGHIDDGSI
jgi:hypothetical protein